MSNVYVDPEKAESEAVARTGRRLAAMYPTSPRLAAAQLPVLLLGEQQAAKNYSGAVAASNPGRLTFAMAASALGFMGELLPDLFAEQGRSYAIGEAIRREYDAAVATEAPAP